MGSPGSYRDLLSLATLKAPLGLPNPPRVPGSGDQVVPPSREFGLCFAPRLVLSKRIRAAGALPNSCPALSAPRRGCRSGLRTENTALLSPGLIPEPRVLPPHQY